MFPPSHAVLALRYLPPSVGAAENVGLTVAYLCRWDTGYLATKGQIEENVSLWRHQGVLHWVEHCVVVRIYREQLQVDTTRQAPREWYLLWRN